jgi:hypothetical protein
MRPALGTLIVGTLLSCTAFAAGHAFNQNFSVLAPAQASPEATQRYADRVLQQAEQYRRELALEWLGEELPSGEGRTLINVSFSNEDSAVTWPIDNDRRTCHMLYLSMSPAQALGASLKHEMLHVIMATRFPQPGRLPSWLEEGMASRYDDGERIAHRREIIRRFARTGRWPAIAPVLNRSSVTGGDYEAYAIAESLTNFLITRADKPTLVEFARDSAAGNTLDALRSHYRFRSIEDLETAWQKWASADGLVTAAQGR